MQSRRSILFVSAVLVILIAGPALEYVSRQKIAVPVMNGFPLLPDCYRTEEATLPWRPEVTGTDRVTRMSYLCGEYPLEVTIAQYVTPSQGKEAVSDLNLLSPRDLRYRGVVLDTSAGIRVNEYHRAGELQELIVWTWYGVGDRSFANPLLVKLTQALDAVRFAPQDSTIFVLTSKGADSDQTRTLLENVQPFVWNWLIETRGL